MKVFVKRYPGKGEFPEEGVMVYAGDGRLYYNYEIKEWICAEGYAHNPLFWLEEIEIPSEEDLQEVIETLENNDNNSPNDEWIAGANYILNKIK